MIHHQLLALAADEQAGIFLVYFFKLNPVLFIVGTLWWQSSLVFFGPVVIVSATVDCGVVLGDYDGALGDSSKFATDEFIEEVIEIIIIFSLSFGVLH
jgi:hypothetical protein